MKKLFLLAAVAIAAITAKANVWNFADDTLNVVAAVEAFADENTTFVLTQKTASEGNPYVAVDYNLSEKAEAVLNFIYSPVEIKFAYSNSSAKTEVLKFYNSYLQINRKGAKMTIACSAGDEIKIYVKSYSKNCEFAVTGADKDVVATTKNQEGVLTVTATDDEVLFDTSSPSSGYDQACQITKIVVGDEPTEGIEDLFYGEKAVKFIENGQLVIVKNGVKFNALGVQL